MGPLCLLVVWVTSWTVPVQGVPPPEEIIGKKMVVQTRDAVYTSLPHAMRGYLRDAGYGDMVTVVEVEPRKIFAKVTLEDKSTAWIAVQALMPPDKFRPDPKTEEEKAKLAAKGFEAGRFNQEVEDKFKAEKNLDGAYKGLDALEGRAHAHKRPKLAEMLGDFHKKGNLGEHSPVK